MMIENDSIKEDLYLMVNINVGDEYKQGQRRLFYVKVCGKNGINQELISTCASNLKDFSNTYNNGANALHAWHRIYFEVKSLDSRQLIQEIFNCEYIDGYNLEELEPINILDKNEFVNYMSIFVGKYLKSSRSEVTKVFNAGKMVEKDLGR